MPSLFISYRRSDAQGWAGHLVADLQRAFPDATIFFDLQALKGGDDFARRIDDALAGCAAVLILIGPQWRGVDRATGRVRIEEPDDWVRVETDAALRLSSALVIPVLLGGARMPGADELPVDLRPLSRLHGLELSDARWDFDFRVLATQLGRLPGLGPAPRVPRSAWAVGVALVAAASIVWWSAGREPARVQAPETRPFGSAAALTASPASSSPAAVLSPAPQGQAASRSQPPPAAPLVVAGRWVTEPFLPAGPKTYSRVQEVYELELRGKDIVGSRTMLSWEGADEAPTVSSPIPISEGRVEDGRVKFCIRLHTFDEGKFYPFKYCYDGLVIRDRMELLIHTNIGHPFGPERSERVNARRTSAASQAASGTTAPR